MTTKVQQRNKPPKLVRPIIRCGAPIKDRHGNPQTCKAPAHERVDGRLYCVTHARFKRASSSKEVEINESP